MAAETASSAQAHGNGPTRAGGSKAKLHGRAFYESIGSPKLVLAPMVEQSEFVCLVASLPSLSWSLLTMAAPLGMAAAVPLLPPALAANESPRLLAHVPLEDVRRQVELPRLALPAPQVDNPLARR
jgi:tRNA-dihydrouridine synthase 1